MFFSKVFYKSDYIEDFMGKAYYLSLLSLSAVLPVFDFYVDTNDVPATIDGNIILLKPTAYAFLDHLDGFLYPFRI